MRNLFVFFCFFFIETICFADNHIPVEVTPEHFGCISNDKRQADNNSIALQNAINYCIKKRKQVSINSEQCLLYQQGVNYSGVYKYRFGRSYAHCNCPHVDGDHSL